MTRVKNDPVKLGDAAKHLAGKRVKMMRPGPVASLVQDPGPPPRDWVVANNLLEKGHGVQPASGSKPYTPGEYSGT